MALSWFTPVFFLCSCVFLIRAENCVVYDFENDAESFIQDQRAICSGMQQWSVGNYSEIGIEAPHIESESFITAGATLSCVTSFKFPMTAGGVIEVNVYMENGNTNQLSILSSMIDEGGTDPVTGSVLLSPVLTDFVSGWQTLRFTLVGIGSFSGYLTLMGMASADSLVLIDSFKYIPPGVDSCNIYSEISTTELPTTVMEEVCVAYNFESDFDIRFTTDNYLCDGFLPWHLDNYTSIDIESPNPSSTVFMAPNEFSSCISSFVFKMSPNGIVEANVYMEPVTALDHIIVLAQRVTEKEYDTVAGFKMYHPENQVFVNGWNVLRFSLLDLTSFEGYIIFIGSADENSTVLVDSVRYIPPDASADDEDCALY